MLFQRKQFTFYRSFYISLSSLPSRKRDKMCWALIQYAMDGIEPEFTDGTLLAVFESIRPILDKARIKAESGKNGGLASGEARSKREANAKQTRSKKEKEIEIEIEGKGEKEGSAPPPLESKQKFLDVFEALSRLGVSLREEDNEDCINLCERHGANAVNQAIKRANDQHVPRWSYIRAIITSGGVSGVKHTKGSYQRHGDPPSPAMLEAVNQMLEEDG